MCTFTVNREDNVLDVSWIELLRQAYSPFATYIQDSLRSKIKENARVV